ncbi:hypothetical protein DENIS_1493 [Desulfonema ishimotonii]|uniref:Uncharacterized protein n=1 Tax=Desulfonema ishimotonii TaxID=45657 RepID=A0A401FU90_9BACT|nr:hypothetical protein [Desulfonema ishimotonii]GBC60536.1 hypothetical protein DENIS_1493 [Desulfonema ishimotonii]
MRKKAEKKIRQAAAELSSGGDYRLDEVRGRAGLHPKIFDKTILDMARLDTIALFTGSTAGMSPVQISNLVRRGDTVYIRFRFTDGSDVPEHQESPGPEVTTTVVILQHLGPDEWESFEHMCHAEEGKRAEQKIREMIREYIRQNRSGNSTG